MIEIGIPVKVIFEFDAIEDRDQLKMHRKAEEYFQAVYEVTLALRNYYKYSELPETASDAEHRVALEGLVKKINESLEGLGYWDED